MPKRASDSDSDSDFPLAQPAKSSSKKTRKEAAVPPIPEDDPVSLPARRRPAKDGNKPPPPKKGGETTTKKPSGPKGGFNLFQIRAEFFSGKDRLTSYDHSSLRTHLVSAVEKIFPNFSSSGGTISNEEHLFERPTFLLSRPGGLAGGMVNLFLVDQVKSREANGTIVFSSNFPDLVMDVRPLGFNNKDFVAPPALEFKNKVFSALPSLLSGDASEFRFAAHRYPPWVNNSAGFRLVSSSEASKALLQKANIAEAVSEFAVVSYAHEVSQLAIWGISPGLNRSLLHNILTPLRSAVISATVLSGNLGEHRRLSAALRTPFQVLVTATNFHTASDIKSLLLDKLVAAQSSLLVGRVFPPGTCALCTRKHDHTRQCPFRTDSGHFCPTGAKSGIFGFCPLCAFKGLSKRHVAAPGHCPQLVSHQAGSQLMAITPTFVDTCQLCFAEGHLEASCPALASRAAKPKAAGPAEQEVVPMSN